MDEIEKKLYKQTNVYFDRSTVCYSLEGRKMELITISSRDGILPEDMKSPDPDLFPDGLTSR
jgi:hypothetical protein